ncbi:hypothetical protein ACWFR1_00260 [Streptomyces sp. NPDC055103]
MAKNAMVQRTIDGCRVLSEAGIVQLTSWIHDLPQETGEDSDLTIRVIQDLAQLPHNEQKHHFFTSFPATDMYEALFGASEDDGRSQRDWARSDTYSGSVIWSGRPDFRRRVLGRLAELREQHPDVLVRPLPHLVEG